MDRHVSAAPSRHGMRAKARGCAASSATAEAERIRSPAGTGRRGRQHRGRNQAGAQDLSCSSGRESGARGCRAERPFPPDQADVRRLFGTALDVLPTPRSSSFSTLTRVRCAERRVCGTDPRDLECHPRSSFHSDYSHWPYRYDRHSRFQLSTRAAAGAKRRRSLAEPGCERQRDLFVSSHGDADLLVKPALIRRRRRTAAWKHSSGRNQPMRVMAA